jgi:dTDP-4-dehydrorhamnose 3,5-epimerase
LALPIERSSRIFAAFMPIRVESTPIEDVKIAQPEVFQDGCGFFTEVYRQDQFRSLRLPEAFAQLNHSGSARNVLRGLHFQSESPMGKLMRVTRDVAFLVAVDIRKGSPTLGQWFGREISAEAKTQIWAPAGFARGFCVLSDLVEIVPLQQCLQLGRRIRFCVERPSTGHFLPVGPASGRHCARVRRSEQKEGSRQDARCTATRHANPEPRCRL